MCDEGRGVCRREAHAAPSHFRVLVPQKVPRGSYPAGRAHVKEVDQDPQLQPSGRTSALPPQRARAPSAFISFPSTRRCMLRKIS